MTKIPEGSNAAQIEYWNGIAGEKWLRNQTILDAVLAPISAAAITAAQARKGEHVLDIGCGCGDTTLALGVHVGAEGHVTGVDISKPMLERARERARKTSLPLGFELADAATLEFADESIDLIFSRFGVMFFDDPVSAFSNLHKALKPNGRLSFVCWRPMKENGWIFHPLQAALSLVPAPEPTPPDAPGPFAFANPDRVSAILGRAGFHHITHTPFDAMLTLGRETDEALHFTMEIGPVSRLIAEQPADQKPIVRDAVRASLENIRTPDGIALSAACWIVSAKA